MRTRYLVESPSVLCLKNKSLFHSPQVCKNEPNKGHIICQTKVHIGPEPWPTRVEYLVGHARTLVRVLPRLTRNPEKINAYAFQNAEQSSFDGCDVMNSGIVTILYVPYSPALWCMHLYTKPRQWCMHQK